MDTITGGSIATDGVIKLTIDSDKIGYIKLPNGSFLTTVAGVLVSAPYSGIGGNVIIYLPKNVTEASVYASGIAGKLTYNGIGKLTITGCDLVTSVTINNLTRADVYGNASLTEILAKKVVELFASNNALYEASMANILYQAYLDNRMAIAYDFRGGNNYLQSNVDAYLLDKYGISYATVYAKLVTANGGTILIDTV